MAETAKTTLSKNIFNVDVPNHELLKLAYDSYLANKRLASATTKQRGEVRGGGKKPWRQKGTGRARFGSSRNPIWRGGGIVFGPSGNENYKKKLSTASKRVALRQALTLANKAKKLVVTEVKTVSKTAEVAAFLKGQKLDETRRIVIVVDKKSPELTRACRNIPSVELITATYITVYHILNADKIIMTPQAMSALTDWLQPTKETA